MYKENRVSLDKNLIVTVFFLLMLGMIMVYSARLPLPSNSDLSFGTYNFGMHPVHIGLGILAMFLFSRVPILWLEKGSGPLLVTGVFLLVLVFFKKIFGGSDVVIDGAVRSLNLNGITFQPAELMKLLVVIFTSAYAVRRKDRIHEDLWRGMGPIGLILFLIIILLMLQPDLGSVIIISSSVITVLFLAGMTLKAIFGVTSCLFTGVFLAIIFT